MATLTFRVGDHIFFICYLKNHLTWFGDFWSKIIEIISKIFLISCSKTFKFIFLELPAEIIKNAIFYFFSNMSWFCFFALVHTLNYNFLNETTVRAKTF
jgi:hypothetical protein